MNHVVLFFFGFSLAMAAMEFVQVLRARIAGRTKNTGRVVLRGLVFVSLTALFVQHWQWWYFLNHFVSGTTPHRVLNTPFITCCVAIGLVLVLGLYDMIGLLRARRAGLTRNWSRIASSAIILISLIPLLQSTVDTWTQYTQLKENRPASTAPRN